MGLLGWIGSAESGEGAKPVAAPVRERRGEPRHDCVGLKLILRQRRGLGIIHLRNISRWGACGITDMPVAVGALVFLELKKGHFYGARVKWLNRFTIGVQFARPLQPETMAKLLAKAQAARAPESLKLN
jgi:hypothetical protein